MIRIPLMLGSSLLALTLFGCSGSGDKGDDGTGTITGDDGGIGNDADGDGYPDGEDCNDNDANVHPGASEVCDNVDNNCDDQVDEGVTSTYYRDADGDGFGDDDNSTDACSVPAGYVPAGNDCDDANDDVYPGNLESCDYADNDCDGDIDEGVSKTYYADSDVDGYGDPDNATESCSQPPAYVTDDTDCDDTTNQAFPGNLEICDEIDNDCDGDVDEGVANTYYADTDKDGYGDPGVIESACSKPTGYATTGTDCDDTDSTVNPAASEKCDLIDNDCDGTTDEDSAIDVVTWYYDSDADGYGDPTITDIDCSQPSGYVASNADCDDTDDTVYSGATELCDGQDNDCNGSIPTNETDDDTDTYVECTVDSGGWDGSASITDGGDCDDTDKAQYPGADEYCNGEDDDCDGSVDEDGDVVDGDSFYADTDSDGLGDYTSVYTACSQPSGYVSNAYDCDDTNGSEPVVVSASTGSPSGSGTLSDPYDSIQDGIDDASSCVIVYKGTYREAIDLDGKSLYLWGVDGAEFTTIDANGSPCDGTDPTGCEPAVTIASSTGATSTIRDFTITGGTGYTSKSTSSTTCADSSSSHDGTNTCTVNYYYYYGGGIYVDGDDPTLQDVIIESNTLPETEQAVAGDFVQNWLYSYGGGIAVINGTVFLDGVSIFSNYGDQGGGIWVGTGGSLDMFYTMVMENSAGDGGGANVSDSGSLSATNSIFGCNEAATDGGGIYMEDTGTNVTVINAVLYQDKSAAGSTHGAGVYGDSYASVTMMNSIIYTAMGSYAATGTGTGTFSYNDVYNSSTSSYTFGGSWSKGTGGITLVPSFTKVTCDGNPDNDDFTLKSTSSCIDAGNPSSSYYDTDGTACDMGAYGGPSGDWD